MQQLKNILIGLGFLWITLWALAGSLLGSKRHGSLQMGDTLWLESWQHQLLRSAHAHMNSMGITLILMGLSLTLIQNFIAPRLLQITVWGNILSILLFGIGLVVESCFPPLHGSVLIAALGGFGYILTMGLWSCFFLSRLFK